MTGDPTPDEVRRFLEIDIQDDDDRDRYLGSPPSGTEVAILKLINGGLAGKFAVGTVVTVTGLEVDGVLAVLDITYAPTVMAANLGTADAPANTYVLGVFVPSRWVYVYNG